MNATTPKLCIVIGASTGGPDALMRMLRKMPDLGSACVVLVQHLSVLLSGHLAAWLTSESGLKVVHPSVRHPMCAGEVVLLTGTHWHLNRQCVLEAYPQALDGIYAQPSIDFLMHSVVEYWQHDAVGVLLTGMGQDGAQGLLAMKQRGWRTYLQNEASCSVYGMPRVAQELGASDIILEPERLGDMVQYHIRHVVG